MHLICKCATKSLPTETASHQSAREPVVWDGRLHSDCKQTRPAEFEWRWGETTLSRWPLSACFAPHLQPSWFQNNWSKSARCEYILNQEAEWLALIYIHIIFSASLAVPFSKHDAVWCTTVRNRINQIFSVIDRISLTMTEKSERPPSFGQIRTIRASSYSVKWFTHTQHCQ